MKEYIITRRYRIKAKDEVHAFRKYYRFHPSLKRDKYLYDVRLRGWTMKDETLDLLFDYLYKVLEKEVEEEQKKEEAAKTDWLKPKAYKSDALDDSDDDS
jgi:hypothetical protein